jgi:4'-phosphopantetheinyl transferase
LAEAGTYAALLSDDERAAAQKYRFSIDRERTLAARALARFVLQEETGLDGRSFSFRLGPFGKPHLVHPQAVGINVSHSGDYVAVALAWEREVGVDIEEDNPRVNVFEVAPTVFTPLELEFVLGAASPLEARSNFYRLWTRKEAVLKVWGTGLTLDAREVSVGSPHGAVKVTHPKQSACWVEDLELTGINAGHASLAGAVAWNENPMVEGRSHG